MNLQKILSAIVSVLMLACPKAKAQIFFDSKDAQAKKVLFIGNSFTYVNQLPLALAALVFDSGTSQHLKVGEIVQGGATLEFLWNQSEARKSIAEDGPWTEVVLQEQSQRPYQEPELMFKSVQNFDAAIRQAHARTWLYQTWCDRNSLSDQELLTASYKTAASKVGAQVVPAGDAFAICLREHPNINLYDADNHHPSKEGTYLAACVFYAKLFDRTPVGLPCDLSVVEQSSGKTQKLFAIDASTAAILQQLALRAVKNYR